MKKTLAAVCTLLLVLLIAPGLASAKTTTVMMYMCGTDLQSDCINDLYEMCAADTSSSLNIVVLAGGAKEWDDSRLKPNRLNLFTIRGGSFSPVTDWGNAGMNDPKTLEKFINYARSEYPADREMLVLWNHGGGSAAGICFDEVHNNEGLSLNKIMQALYAVYSKDNSFHLDLFGCDACMMGTYEMAAAISGYADYYVASEELEPGTGWYYTPWLSLLARDPDVSTEKVGRAIVDSFVQGVREADAQSYTTLSLIDCKRVGALRSDMEVIASYMEQALENGQLATIRRMVSRMYCYGSYYSAEAAWDMYDMGDFLTIAAQFAPNTARDARTHLQNAVVYSYASDDMPVASGMSVFIPNSIAESYLSSYCRGYQMDDCYPNYSDFVAGLCALMNGSNYSFQASQPTVEDVSTVGDTAFSFGSASFGFIPGGTYIAETPSDTPAPDASSEPQSFGEVPGFIAGSINQHEEASTAAEETGIPSFGDVPGFIAGSANQEQETTDSEESQSGSIFDLLQGFIPGAASQQSAASYMPEDTGHSLAFSLQLSQDAINNLDYAEGQLYMDISDDDGVYLIDLGYLQNSWIDWENCMVYSTFDGKWPTLDGQVVVMYDQSSNAISRRSLIPVRVNGHETYLVVTFEGSSGVGTILGYNDGVDDNGLPIRRTTKLEPGDVIVPMYSMLWCSWDDLDNDSDMETVEFDGQEIIWEDGMQVIYMPLADEDDPTDYQFAFYLNDIFGEYEMSDFIPFTL